MFFEGTDALICLSHANTKHDMNVDPHKIAVDNIIGAREDNGYSFFQQRPQRDWKFRKQSLSNITVISFLALLPVSEEPHFICRAFPIVAGGTCLYS